VTQPPGGDSGEPPATRERASRSSGVDAQGTSAACVLLIGPGQLPDATAQALAGCGAEVRRLDEPSDAGIREALEDTRVDRVIVISRDDHVSLRHALVVAHVRPGISMLVTVFDRDVAEHLRDSVKNVDVLSMADIVAPSFAGPCLDPDLISIVRRPSQTRGITVVHGRPSTAPLAWDTRGGARRVLRALEALLVPFDSSARILVYGVLGFLAVLLVETAVTMVAAHSSLIDALYSVAKVTVTVGPSSAVDQGGNWLKLFSTVTMLLTLGIAAVLTAGLVNRLLDPRLTGILGRSAVPRRDHVVVVGLGQVGFRLGLLLRELGVPVILVEQNPEAKNVPRAKDQRLPIVIGSGAAQRLLRRLSIRHARALAAVTSDEVENIAIAVAARGLRQDLPIALRAGDGDATSETQSLFRVGVVRDVYRIAGAALTATILGNGAHEAFPHGRVMYLVDKRGAIAPFPPTV
jgi:hypothetical protein